MAGNLGAVAQLLEATLDPRQNKQAESALQQEEKNPGYSLQLLQVTATESYPYSTRLASALAFKNFIKHNYVDEDGNYKLPLEEVVTIKRELINLMVSVPPGIQSQLGEAVSMIADSDFYERWDTLVDDLVSRLQSKNPAANNGVLQVAHSIFKKWRPAFQSDQLYTEINHVLDRFGNPYLEILKDLDSYIDENSSNKQNLTLGFTQLNLMIKLMYDLSCHDLPPMFESHLSDISALLLKYLTYDNQLLHTDDDSEAGLLEFCRAGVFEVLKLFVTKFMEDFGPHVNVFVESSWSFLATIGKETKYDLLVSRALNFLTSIVDIPEQAAVFQNEATLGQIIEKVILPSVSLRESDEELFEDEPIEFIRRDLEGSDTDTRRRAATDFLRKLAEKFEASVTKSVLSYTQHHLNEYTKDPASNWKAKDTATYLFSAIAAKGVATASHGVTTTNPLVSIVEYFQNYLAADMVSQDDINPILKKDAIKYLYVFRSVITKEQWQEVFPSLVNQLGSSNYVIYTYAAIAVERVLYLTDNQGQPIIAPSFVTPLAKDLLEHIFSLIEKDPTPQKLQENEFLMRCAMRVLIVVKEGVVPFMDAILQHLLNITMVISQNPSNPRFYYFHFEALGAFIRFAAPANPEKLEQALYPPFANILQGDIQEFMPYVFQLFAALLEANPSGTLPDYYQNLIAPILMPVMWDSKRGNVPALVRLLSSILSRGSQHILANQQLESVLGVFQKLIAQKASESQAFDLLESVIANFPPTALEQYFVSVMSLVLTRLQNKKTESLTLRFVRFFHFICAHDDKGYSADFFITVMDKVQEGLFTPIYLNIILPDTQKLARPVDRKTAVLSFTKILANSEAFASRYKKGWGFTCTALLKLLELAPLPASKDDIIAEHDVEDMAFGVGFTALNTIRQQTVDPWPDTGADLKAWVGQYLKEADQKSNGRVSSFAQERLEPEAQKMLISYIA